MERQKTMILGDFGPKSWILVSKSWTFSVDFLDFHENARSLHQNFSTRSPRILTKSDTNARSRPDLAFASLFVKIRDGPVEDGWCEGGPLPWNRGSSYPCSRWEGIPSWTPLIFGRRSSCRKLPTRSLTADKPAPEGSPPPPCVCDTQARDLGEILRLYSFLSKSETRWWRTDG